MPDADLIIIEGKLATIDAPAARATALAIAGNRILALGSTSDIRALAGRQTRIVDAGQCTVMPGFVESHMHLFAGAAELDHLQLSGILGRSALAAAVRDHAARHPEKPVLLAQGADYSIISERQRVSPPRAPPTRCFPRGRGPPAMISTRPSATAPSPWRRPTTTPCGVTRLS